LNVIPLVLPTLAERKEDIPALVEHFVQRHGGPAGFGLSRESYEAMVADHWPGNVRELGNVVERMLVRADGNITTAARLLGLPRSTLRSKLERGEG
jgi:DNA-binding NtrC family response regulator